MKLRWLAMLAPAAIGVAAAQSEPDPRASYALNLFGTACMAYLGDADRTSAWAGLEDLPPIAEDELAALLHGKKGHGWNASGPNGDALLILREDGSCSVWARRAPASAVNAWVHTMMEQAGRSGSRAEQIEDREVEGNGGRYRVLAYRLSAAESPRQFLLTVTSTDADNGEVVAQVILSIAEVAVR
jgi:hypothetical protein